LSPSRSNTGLVKMMSIVPLTTEEEREPYNTWDDETLTESGDIEYPNGAQFLILEGKGNLTDGEQDFEFAPGAFITLHPHSKLTWTIKETVKLKISR